MTAIAAAKSNGGKKIQTLEDFITVHGILLTASGIPQSLYPLLFQKLTADTFDGGDYFQVEPVDDGRQRRLVLTADSLKKDSNLFLIDHAWTFRLADAYKQLQEIPGLAERMASLMCVDIDSNSDIEEEEEDETHTKLTAMEIVEKSKEERWLELEELEIDDSTLISFDLPSKFPNLLALSLCNNKLNDIEVVTKEITQFKHLKALWLNDNPILKTNDGDLKDAILKNCPELEIYNSKFTSNFGEWALKFCGGIIGKDNYLNNPPLNTIDSLDLSNRNINNLINKAFSPTEIPSLSYLNLRGNPLIDNSINDLLTLLQEFNNLVALEVDIPGPLGNSAIKILESLPRIASLNGVNTSHILESQKHIIDSVLKPRLPEWTPGEPLADRVITAMWLYLMTYRLADETKLDETSIMYVMDELGSALRHSDKPNFRVSPFLYMPEGEFSSAISYSILWPIENIQKDDECTRDFLYGIGEEKHRSARLTAWFHTPINYFITEYEKYIQNSNSKKSPSLKVNEFSSSCTKNNTILRVFTDIPYVEEYLTRPEFVFTNEPKEADIIWTSEQVDEELKKNVGLTNEHYINQFPYEACLVMKHHLAETIKKAYGCVKWIQSTYNLESELSYFIGDYLVRERDGLNNLWILKPWNMARTIDTCVTGNLSAVIRLMETGPKICQKYIEQPALFQGRKFDLRYIVLVRSVNPLEIFLTDVFWVRLANNTYTLDKQSLFEYETHFTVMNYNGRLNHMNTPEFVKEFEKEHEVKWMDIHEKVKKMIRLVFEGAANVHPEMHNLKSRAIYGVDVMLTNDFQPKLLEVTYCPDCDRACKYDTEAVVGDGSIVKGSEFFNNIFGCLFLNETSHISRV